MSWVKWWYREFGPVIGSSIPFVAFLVFLAILRIDIVPGSGRVQPNQENGSERFGNLPPANSSTPELAVTLSLVNKYLAGDKVKLAESAHENFCAELREVAGKMECWRNYSQYLYFAEVIGPPKAAFNQNYYPVKILLASSWFSENQKGWLPDHQIESKVEMIPPPAKPSIKIGDRGHLAYGQPARSSPAGTALIGSKGDVLYVQNQSLLEVSEAPILIEGHWWCKVKVVSALHEPSSASWLYQLSLPSSWIICEIQVR